jgi:uncharacterized delta-60 repeat protein
VESLERRQLFAAGTLDPTLGGGDGSVTVPLPDSRTADVFTLDDGRSIVVGDYRAPSGERDMFVARLTYTGALDPTFGGGKGYTQIDFRDDDTASVVKPGFRGQIFVGGYTASGPETGVGVDFAVARLTGDGALDTTFSNDGRVVLNNAKEGGVRNDFLRDLHVLGNSALVVGTSESTDGSNTSSVMLARFKGSGALDNQFGGGTGYVAYRGATQRAEGNAIAYNGAIFVGGSVLVDTPEYAPSTDLAVFRFYPDGRINPKFLREGVATHNVGQSTNTESGETVVTGLSNDAIYDLSVPPGSDIIAVGRSSYVEGSFDPVVDQVLVRFSQYATVKNIATDGIYDTGSAPQLTFANELQIVDDKIITAGSGNYGSVYAARYNFSDFSADATFNPGAGGADHVASYATDVYPGNERVGLTIARNGAIVLAGETATTDDARGLVVRFNGTFVDLDDQIEEVRYRDSRILHPESFLGVTSDRLFNSTDVNIYEIPLYTFRGDAIRIDLDRTGDSGLDSYMRLFEFGSEGRAFELASNDNGSAVGEGATNDSYLEFMPTLDYVYLAVSGKFNRTYNAVTGDGDVGSSWGGYTLRLNPVDYNKSRDTSQALLGNLTAFGRVEDLDDEDFYKLEVQAGQTYEFDVDNNGSKLDGHMRLFAATGDVALASNDNGTAPGEQPFIAPFIRHTFATSGTYYVAISGKGNTGYDPDTGLGGPLGSSVGDYNLNVRLVGEDNPADVNRLIGTATPAALNATKTNESISPGTDVDMFKFTVTAGQRVGFDVDTNGSPLDSYMRLFDADGEQLAASDNGVAPGEQMHRSPYLAYTFTTAGTYYVGISGKQNTFYRPLTGLAYRDGDSTGAYTLDLRVL